MTDQDFRGNLVRMCDVVRESAKGKRKNRKYVQVNRRDFVALPLPCQEANGVCSELFCTNNHAGDCKTCRIAHTGKCCKAWRRIFPACCEQIGMKWQKKVNPMRAPLIVEESDGSEPDVKVERKDEKSPLHCSPVQHGDVKSSSPKSARDDLGPVVDRGKDSMLVSSPCVDGFDLLERNSWPVFLPSPNSMAGAVMGALLFSKLGMPRSLRLAACITAGCLVKTALDWACKWVGGYKLVTHECVITNPTQACLKVEQQVLNPIFCGPSILPSVVDFLTGRPVIRVGRMQRIATGHVKNGELDVRSYTANTTELVSKDMKFSLYKRYEALTGTSTTLFFFDHCLDSLRAGVELIPVDEALAAVQRKAVNNTCLNLSPDQYAKNALGVAQYVRAWYGNQTAQSRPQPHTLNLVGGAALCCLGTAMCVVTFPRLLLFNYTSMKLSGGILGGGLAAYTLCRLLLARC